MTFQNFLEKSKKIIKKSEQAEKFSKLYYEGDISSYSDDDSSADMALCCILAFYCGEDFELIDKLFSNSKLYRKKLDRNRSSHFFY